MITKKKKGREGGVKGGRKKEGRERKLMKVKQIRLVIFCASSVGKLL